MTTALTGPSESGLRLKAIGLRRHAAVVRGLLVELERIDPSPDVSAREDGLVEQLIEELTRLGFRILELTEKTIHAPESEEPIAATDRSLEEIPIARAAA
jgi:hypothetical protein